MQPPAGFSNSLLASPIRAVLFFSLLAAIAAGGCSRSNPVSPPPDGGTSNTMPVSPSRRTQILNSLSSFADSLNGLDPAADAEKVKDFLQSQPEIARAGISPTGSIWAIFADGRLLIRSNAFQPDTAGSAGSNLLDMPILKKRSNHLPDGNLAIVLNSLGSAFDPVSLLKPPGGDQSRKDIGKMLSDAGYFVDANHDASVDGLLTLISNVSVLHWSAHGDQGMGRDSNLYYGIWTTSLHDTANEANYKVLLDNNELVYFNAPNTIDWALGPLKSESHYAITPAFVRNHMQFTGNSLVYISACWSGAYQTMRDAFQFAGASLYGGWSNAVDPKDAFAAARFFFDRTLGANSVDPVPNPKQRPFEYTLVWEDMSYRGLTHSTTSHGPSQFSFSQLKPDFSQLLPSLEFAVPEFDVTKTELALNGSFGDKAGIVTLNGSTIPFTSWGNSVIVLDHPPAGGNLKVKVGQFESNTIPLTEWDGTVSYTQTGQQTLSKTASFSVKLIADVHRFRVVSGANIVWQDNDVFLIPRAIVLSGNSGGSYTCSGENRDQQTNELLESWDGGGSLSPIQFGSVGTGFSVVGRIDSVGGYANFTLTMSAPYTRYTKAGGSNLETMSFGCTVQVSVGPGYVLPPFSSPPGSSTYSWSGATGSPVQGSGDKR